MATDDDAAQDGTLSLPAEWARGRDTIDKCDERIQDIRKQGLTFLTGLLTAQAVLGLAQWTSDDGRRRAVSLALLGFSLLVILAVRLFEKQNQMLQAAAASRCLVIESYLPAELTGVITDRHLRQRWPLLTFLLYLSFGALVLVLYEAVRRSGGGAGPRASLARWVEDDGYGVAILVAFAAALAVFSIVDLRPTRVRGLDWSLSKTVARPGELVHVRVVNLDSRRRRLPSYPLVLKIDDRVAPRALEDQPPPAAAGAATENGGAKRDVVAAAFGEWLDSVWWRAIDAVPGRLELGVAAGSVATLLLGFERFALVGSLAWAGLAAALVTAGIAWRVELVRAGVIGWPLGAGAVLVLARALLPGETLEAARRLRASAVGAHEGAVILALLVLAAGIALVARALAHRLSRHETVGRDHRWPEGWRWSTSGAVCFLPPLGAYVWTIQVPYDATELRVCLDDQGQQIYLRKRIVVQA